MVRVRSLAEALEQIRQGCTELDRRARLEAEAELRQMWEAAAAICLQVS